MHNPLLQFKELSLIKLIVGCSSIYLAILPVGLPHIMFFLGLALVLKNIIQKNKVSLNCAFIFVLFLYGFGYIYNGSDWKTVVNNVSSMMMMPIILEILNKYEKKYIIEISSVFIKWTIRCFIVECIIRYVLSILHPMGSGIYMFKFNSVVFQDTNFLGLSLLVVIFFIKYLQEFYKVQDLKKNYVCGIILLLLSISRAAILGWIIGEFLFRHLTSENFRKKVLMRFGILFIVGFFTGTILYTHLYDDPSFKSKLYIFEMAEDIISYYRFNTFYGVGYGNSEQILGIFPHNSLFLYYFEIGKLGLGIKILCWIFILIKSKMTAIIVLFPYLIATMSATGYATHYLYVCCALIILMTRKCVFWRNVCQLVR